MLVGPHHHHAAGGAIDAAQGKDVGLGPLVGALGFTWLHDTVARGTEYWRALLGGIILLLVLLFPQGLAGFARQWFGRKEAS